MDLDDYFTVIAPNDIRIKGTRVGIETVLYDFVHRSDTPEAIAARYPSLTLEQVYATITYYLHNQVAVSAYLAEWLEHGRRMRQAQDRNPPPDVVRLRRIAAERRVAADVVR
jgi:uncharacterized protein (DUF433 family)